MSVVPKLIYRFTPEFHQLMEKLEKFAAVNSYNFQVTTKKSPSCLWIILSKCILTIHIIFCILMWLTLRKPNKNPLEFLLQLAASCAYLTSFNLSFDFSWYREEYEKLFMWMGKLQREYPGKFKEKLERSPRIIFYSKIFTIITWILILIPPPILQMASGQIWDENDEFILKLPIIVHLPGIKPINLTTYFINWAFQAIAEGVLIGSYSLFFANLFLLTMFFEASFDVVNEFVNEFIDKIICKQQSIDFNHEISKIVKMHNEVTGPLQQFINMTCRSILCFEINSFVIASFIYIAVFIFKEQQSLALGGFITMTMHFWFAYLNGILYDANDRLLYNVIDIPWYEIPPKNRHSLVLIIMKLQRPQLLQSQTISGRKQITYERFGEVMRLVYRYCLAVQNLI